MAYTIMTVFILLAASSITVQAQTDCLTPYGTCVSNILGTQVAVTDMTAVIQALPTLITSNKDKICQNSAGFAKCITDFGSCLGAGTSASLDTMAQTVTSTCASVTTTAKPNNGSPSKTYGALSFLSMALFMIF